MVVANVSLKQYDSRNFTRIARDLLLMKWL